MRHFKFLTLMLAMIASVGFMASCSNDDDDDKGTTANALVGTWRKDNSTVDESYLYTFTSDGKCEHVKHSTWADCLLTETWKGTYTKVENDIVINATVYEVIRKDLESNETEQKRESRNDSYSRAIVSLTANKMVWKYQSRDDNGTVTVMESYTKQ